MIRAMKSTLFAAVLALTVVTTANRSDAQEFYPFAPAPGYFSEPNQAGTFWAPYTLPALQSSTSYYPPPLSPNAAYTPVRAWDGGWTVSGYTSPAIPFYNSYRATGPGIRR